MTELTDKERLFVTECLVDLNALRAGYANGDVANARVAGHRLRRRKHVAEAIAKLIEERSSATRSRVIEEVSRLAFVQHRPGSDGRGRRPSSSRIMLRSTTTRWPPLRASKNRE